jgi:hypothetical protein
MSRQKRNVRVVATALPRRFAAWPLPSDGINYLNAVRGNFPGDDDQLLLVSPSMLMSCVATAQGSSSHSSTSRLAVHAGLTPGARNR